MKLSEVLICTAIFSIMIFSFGRFFLNVRTNIFKSIDEQKNALIVLKTDEILREEISKIDIAYWKNFDAEIEVCLEYLDFFCKENAIDVVLMEVIFDKAHNANGIKIEWEKFGKSYTVKEFIHTRIFE